MSSTAPKIILQCETNTCHMNPYIATILHMWKANMDIQFIENAVNAVMYVCSYMMKAEKGMEELLKRICKEVHEQEIKDQLRVIGLAFLSSHEVSAQEGAMKILSVPLIQKSRKVVFVSSASKDNCVSMPKSSLQLEDHDEDIFATTIHD